MIFLTEHPALKGNPSRFIPRDDVKSLGGRNFYLDKFPTGDSFDSDDSQSMGMDALSFVFELDVDTLTAYAFSRYWAPLMLCMQQHYTN